MTVVSETLQTAVQHHQAGELDRAESLYHEIIRADPQHADALHLLGVTAHQRAQNEIAVQHIQRAIEINGTTALYHSNLGTCYRALGRLTDAVASFREAIRIAPRFAGAHYNLGMAQEALGRPTEAIAAYREALRLEPDFLDAWNNLGRVYLSIQQFDEAIDCFRCILEFAPDSADIHYNLGNALHQKGDLRAAEAAFRDALRFNPRMAPAYNNLGSVLTDLQLLDEAIACFDKAIALQPGYSDAERNRSSVLQARSLHSEIAAVRVSTAPISTSSAQDCCARAAELENDGRFDEAATLYQQVISLDPSCARAHFGLGFALLSAGKHDEAREAYTAGLAIDAQNAGAWINLGAINNSLRDLSEAARCFRKVVEIDPHNAKAHYNLGNVYKDLWQLDEAASCYRHAVEIDPHLAEAHINLGVVLQHLGRLDEALASHDRALAIRPNDAETHFHRSLTQLLRGDFADAWEEYEWRWDYEASPRKFPQPVWDGGDLGNNSLLIYAEQGIGDEILFASCLPDVVGLARECCIECDSRLVPMFARSFPLATVVGRPVTKELPPDPATLDCDLQIAMGSLPRHFRRSVAAFPWQRRFLVAESRLVSKWRKRLAELGTGLKVGISWRGGHKPSIRQRRSIGLDRWKPIFSVPGVQFINLQYGDSAAEIEQIRDIQGIEIHHWDDVNPLVDLEEFAAQITALDLVISVDNSTVHMAGALGVPVWTLLHFSPNWRWLIDREDSCWYSSARLFRQPRLGEWEPVVHRVAAELLATANCGRVTILERPQAAAAERLRSSETLPAQPAVRPASVDKSLGDVPSPARGAVMLDADAAREKEKYEKAWTRNEYRQYSPGLAALERLPLIDMLRKHGVRTILDAGCGSGKMMQRLMTQYGNEFAVHGFDISENCLDSFFDGIRDQVLTIGCLWNPDDFQKQYDAVLCADVMEHIPTQHVPAVLTNLRKSTRKAAYFSISVQADYFGPKFFGEPLHLTIRRPNWWFAQLALAGFRISGYVTANDKDGEEAQLHVFLTV